MMSTFAFILYQVKSTENQWHAIRKNFSRVVAINAKRLRFSIASHFDRDVTALIQGWGKHLNWTISPDLCPVRLTNCP